MEYIEWPTLGKVLQKYHGRCLKPRVVARILSELAEAQAIAHSRGLPLGPLSPNDIYVDKSWAIRISPFRLGALVPAILGLADGLTFHWKTLSRLPPELYEGHLPTPSEYDSAGQYYLGVLGLELLRGNQPVEVARLADLDRMRALYLNPLEFFIDPADLGEPWTERSPALSFVIARLLEREPLKRYESAEEAANELKQVADGNLPKSVKQEIQGDYDRIMSFDFAQQFYNRLFSKKTGRHLKKRFSNPTTQHIAFAKTLRTIDTYISEGYAFKQLFDDHAIRYKITTADVDVFQKAFLEQIDAAFPGSPRKCEAWKVALHHPFADLRARLRTSASTTHDQQKLFHS